MKIMFYLPVNTDKPKFVAFLVFVFTHKFRLPKCLRNSQEPSYGSQSKRAKIAIQVLKIRSALYPRDVGDFKCVASNGVSPDAELSVSLDVQGTYKQRNTFVLYVTSNLHEYMCNFLPHLQLMICSEPTSRAVFPLYSCTKCDPM